MKGVLKYPGAKNRIAEWICGNIPQHNVYLEPCVIRTRGEMREPISCNRGVLVYER